MIYYNCEKEAWVDTQDPKFRNSMTPEGNSGWRDKEFLTQEEFYQWINSNE